MLHTWRNIVRIDCHQANHHGCHGMISRSRDSGITYQTSKYLTVIALAQLVLALAGCAMSQGPEPIHAHGLVAGRLVNTRVDSPLAEYYIEDYQRGDRHRADLNKQLRRIAGQWQSGIPDRETLTWITNRYSRDVATIFLVERLASVPANRRFTDIYLQQLELVAAGALDPGEATPLKSDVVFLVVPGWYWRDPSFDGSLEIPRQHLEAYGYQTELLPTDEQGSVEENAELVAARLRHLREAGKWVVVVSVSKGGAEAALALGGVLSWEESAHVLAWLNVNGGLRGSPLADEMLNWRRNLITRLLMRLVHQDSVKSLSSMRTGRRRRVFESLRFPPRTLIVNFTAVPFSGQVTPRSGRYEKLLNDYGPNDGSLLTHDELIADAPTVVELGFDHYFFDPMIGQKAVAMVRALDLWLQVSGKPLATPLPARPSPGIAVPDSMR